ncbi:hypothetical protein FRC04_000765 [Tulasnella sp. 424]|nr:hypothetical protein FRC04_000765 [Tulasnella sp. 424]
MFTQLPAELILIIAEYVDMLQQCSLMRTFSTDLLDPDLHRRGYRLHETLLKKPALIDQIVTYYGPIFPPKPKPTFEDPRWDVGTIFQRAVNIRDLYFTGYINWIQAYDWIHIKEAVEQMVLERLVIQIGGRSVDVIPLLRTQPELTRLELLWGADGWEELKKKDIPKLKSLTATLDVAALIVPGRPVEEIDLLPSQSTRRVDEKLLQCFSLSLRPIRKLGMKLYNPFDEDSVRDALQAVARELPFIEELTISVGGKISSRMLLLEIPDFTCIRILTLLDASLISDPASISSDDALPAAILSLDHDSDSSARWADLEARLKETCPTLTNVYRTPLVYLHWKR